MEKNNLSAPPLASAGPIVTNPPDAEQIARRAYELWEQEGRPSNRAEDHWFKAEQELAGKTATAPTSYTEVEEHSKRAYSSPGQKKGKVSERKKHWLEAEAEMRRQEQPPRLIPPVTIPPPTPPIEPVKDGRPDGPTAGNKVRA